MFRYSGYGGDSVYSGQIGRHPNLSNPYGISHYTADGQYISGLLNGLMSGDLLYIYNDADGSLAKLLQITANSGEADRNKYWTLSLYNNFGNMKINAIYYMTPYYVRAGASGYSGQQGQSGYSGLVMHVIAAGNWLS